MLRLRSWIQLSFCSGGLYAKRPTAYAIGRFSPPKKTLERQIAVMAIEAKISQNQLTSNSQYWRTGTNSSELLRRTSSLRPCPLLAPCWKHMVGGSAVCQQNVTVL